MIPAEKGAGQLAHDRDLAAQVLARWRQAAPRQVHHGHRVLDRDELLAARLDVAVGAAERRKDEGRRPCTTWLRLSLVEICTVSAQLRSAASVTSVSGVADAKLPPMPMKTLASPSRIARIASTVSWPCLRGLVMPKRVSRAARNCSGIFSQMPIVRSPCTFECPRTGHTPGAGLADHAAHQQQVGGLADGGHRVPVLRQSHGPAEDRPLRGDEHPCDALELLRSRCRSRPTRCPDRLRACGISYSSKPAQCAAMKSRSSTRARRCVVGLQQQSAQPREQRHVAAESDLHELVGDRNAVTDDPVHLLRILEPHQSRLRQRVDRDDLGAVAPWPSPASTASGDGWCRGSGRRSGCSRRPRRPRRSPNPCRCRSRRSVRCPTTRGTCWSSPAGCSCRSCGPATDRGTRPRCWCGPTCRTAPRRGWRGR